MNRDLQRATSELSDFIELNAAATAGLVGFGWEACRKAPNKYPALKRAFAESMRTGLPLPISDENTGSVIYRDPGVNMAFRYWHDSMHVVRGLDFTPPQELHLATIQLRVLEQAGCGPETLTWRLLHADLVGQVYLSAVGRRFPEDQRRFVINVLEEGLEAAILGEIADAAPSTLPAPVLESLAA